MDCAENEYVAEIEQCLPIYKKEKSNLSMTDWPCHAWLQKKKYHPPTRQPWEFVTNVYVSIWVTGFCVLYHQNIIFIWGNSVYQQWTICPLKSEIVSEMHFPGIWRPNFKISPLGAHHGGTLRDTDLANST